MAIPKQHTSGQNKNYFSLNSFSEVSWEQHLRKSWRLEAKKVSGVSGLNNTEMKIYVQKGKLKNGKIAPIVHTVKQEMKCSGDSVVLHEIVRDTKRNNP